MPVAYSSFASILLAVLSRSIPILYSESSGFEHRQRLWENGNLHYQKTWESGLSAHGSGQNGSENDSSQESLKLILSVTVVHTIFSMIIDIHWFPARLSDDLSVSGPLGLNFCFVCMIFVQFSVRGDSKCLYSG